MRWNTMVAGLMAVVLLAATVSGCATEPELALPQGLKDKLQGTTATDDTDSTAAPTDPAPTDPAPTDPAPTDPAPTDPTPTDSTEPQDSQPTEPTQAPTQNQGMYTRAELDAMDTKVNGWGLGPSTDDENRPYDSINAQKKYGQYGTYFIAPSDGKIYLTFDEGYENGYTALILDTLKEKDVKAVFFITMQYAKSSPELVQRMIDEGHVVGNHSVRHKSMPTLTVDEMVAEVTDLHEYVLEHFGYEMFLFRPPTGEYSQQSLAVVQNLGYTTVEWSFAHYDYDVNNQPDQQKTYDKIVNAAHSGAIYLLHAVSETNTAVLGDVIDAFRNQGFELALMDANMDWAEAT